jgi:hypothetical protein
MDLLFSRQTERVMSYKCHHSGQQLCFFFPSTSNEINDSSVDSDPECPVDVGELEGKKERSSMYSHLISIEERRSQSHA